LPPGVDVEHDQHSRGWVWGSGLSRVTVRFEIKDNIAGSGLDFRSPTILRSIDYGPELS
jgi:hypothetical protein